MIFEYISPLEVYENVKFKTFKQLPKHQFGFLEINDNKLTVFINNKLYKVEILNKKFEIMSLVKNKKLLLYIDLSSDKSFTAIIYVFSFYKELSSLQISIDDKILEDAKKYGIIKQKDLESLKENFKKNTQLQINNQNYSLLSIQNIDELDNFILYADGFRLSVKASKIGDEIELKIVKIIKSKSQKDKNNNLILVKADIDFTSGLISDKVAKSLQEILSTENGYINVWYKFLEKEGEFLLKKVKDIGELSIKEIIPHEETFEFVLDKIPDQLQEGDSLVFYPQKPFYLEGDFITFAKQLEENLKTISNDIVITIKDIKENSIFSEKLEYNIEELKKHKLYLSILGDKVQISRKLKAKEIILEGKSANPYLGLIIEDSDKIKNYQISPPPKIEPLSEFVKNKIFSNPPTENQIKAIDIALNTPDIAVIQGPPGTGKTTVITAIIERINELKDKENLKGQVLVVGYQHEAVSNLTQRLKVNSLPAIKFGNKDEKEEIQRYEMVLKWADTLSQKAKSQCKNYSEQKNINQLDILLKGYRETPTNQAGINFLEKLKMINTKYLKEIEELQNNLREHHFDITELAPIYAIRTTKSSFLDDGKKQLQQLLKTKFIEILDEDEIEILEKADVNYLSEYKKIKTKLIKNFYPKPKYQKPKPNKELLELIEKVKKDLKNGNTKKDRINKILFDYINELQNNPFALEDTIKDYSLVFAASVQQSAREEINKSKKEEFYDVVIVDEAARVPPMDLFIPMVKGKKIILVGDHKQLPHLVDDTILKEIKDDSDIEEELLKESMFEYLKKRVQKLEEFDGIKRYITLNNQYRTHPLLGNFISQNFYEKDQEGFNSPLPEEFFIQELEGIENTPAVWIDVKNSECSEKKEISISRECEAKTIIKYLKKWVYSEKGKNLTYGIISFYGKQVELLQKLVKEIDTNTEIKVGTVDAFQGREFDIVFLSATRSKPLNQLKDNPKGLFGFLVSKNRLNVAMSRQKKALVVVGDLDYFSSKYAQKYLPEMVNFISLCKQKGKIL